MVSVPKDKAQGTIWTHPSKESCNSISYVLGSKILKNMDAYESACIAVT